MILEEMAEARDVPEDHLHDAFVRRLWPAHPLGAPVFGTEESVRALSRTDLAARFRELFRPGEDARRRRGRLRPGADRGAPRAGSRAGPGPRRGAPRGGAAPEPTPGAPLPSRRAPTRSPPDARPDRRAHDRMGRPPADGGVARGDDPRGGRLVAALARRPGEARPRLPRRRRAHRSTARRDSRSSRPRPHPKNLATLVRAAGRILHRLLADGVTKAELSRAKNQMRAEIALSLESTAARREAAARAWLVKGRPVPPEEVLAEVAAATADDVAEAARPAVREARTRRPRRQRPAGSGGEGGRPDG